MFDAPAAELISYQSDPLPQPGPAMMKDGTMHCDQCQTAITRVTDPPADGWPKLHALCHNCFEELSKKGTG